jgi:epoxyqueuosine reductase
MRDAAGGGAAAAFLAAGRHGQMGWMADREDWRGNPAALWPEARSVIMLAEVYTPEGDPLAVLDQPDRARWSASMRRARITMIWSSGG